MDRFLHGGLVGVVLGQRKYWFKCFPLSPPTRWRFLHGGLVGVVLVQRKYWFKCFPLSPPTRRRFLHGGLGMMIFFYKKSFFIWFLFLWSVVFVPVVVGGPEQWMRASSQKALKKQIQKEERAEKLKMLCFLQLKKKQSPYFCYEWLNSVSAKGGKGLANKAPKAIMVLFEDKVSPSFRSHKAFLMYLNERCQNFASNLKDLKKIVSILQMKSVSAFCRKQIEKQKQILEYQLRDKSPKKLLNWHAPQMMEQKN